MDFPKLLGLRPGVTAVIGSGGKTSLLRRLAEELPGTVLLCTTTHIRPFEEYPLLTAPTPEDIRKALTAHRVLCLGTPCENGKLTAPSLSVETLATLADYVLVEADGSRQLPLKAHEAHEPVIPAVSRQVICVVGASGFGKPIRESVHRPEQFCALTDREREALGLRTLIPAGCTLSTVVPAGVKEGLSVEGLTCAYRKEPPVFQALSFSARPGEVVAITGPNGVGKTTLSRCLCGLIREQAGQIRLDGRPLNRKERQKAAFCVMQDVNHQLFSDSVWGECRMSAPDAPDSTVEGVLDSLHLLPFRERHPMSLSGGQKQRLAVATALLSEKPILIFDEPTSGLDYARMVEVSGVIRSLAQQGRIVLVVTHDQEFLQRACDRVLRL